LDFNGQKKEESDFMCFEVLNNNGKTIANSETCQRDDIKRRRLESYTVLKNSRDKATTEWDADMHLEDHGEDENDVKERQITTKLRNGKENVRIMESADLPAKLLANGIKIKLSAVTNLHAEHWYADDLKVTCRRIVQYAEVVCGKQQHSNKKGCLNPGMKGKTEKHEVRCCSDTAKAGWRSTTTSVPTLNLSCPDASTTRISLKPKQSALPKVPAFAPPTNLRTTALAALAACTTLTSFGPPRSLPLPSRLDGPVVAKRKISLATDSPAQSTARSVTGLTLVFAL